MAQQQIEGNKAIDTDVIITRQNWFCQAGYCLTASIRQNLLKTNPKMKVYSKYTHWGEELFSPERRMNVTDPKNGNYGLNPNPDPFDLCVKYCEENNLSYTIQWHESSE